ncbi:MAG: hypothetical protein ACI9CA_001153 [Natronomonas sp.]|jgi:hypothetical protein
MTPTKTLGVLLALLVVATGAAAAMPGNAPVDAPDRADNQTADAEAEAAQAEPNETAGERGLADRERGAGGPPGAAGERGPPTDMPGAVPDFVSEVHATVQDHLGGAVEDLGAAISGSTPDDADDATAVTGR